MAKHIDNCQTPVELAEAIAYHLKQGGMRRDYYDQTGLRETKYDEFESKRLYGTALNKYNEIRKLYPNLPSLQITTSDPLSGLAQIQQLCASKQENLQEVIEVLKKWQKSEKAGKDFDAAKSALSPIAKTYDILCRTKGRCGAKTTDIITQLGFAANHGQEYCQALLNERASPEVIADLEQWQEQSVETEQDYKGQGDVLNLIQIAQKVGSLLTQFPLGKSRFQEQIRAFFKKSDDYNEILKKHLKDVEANPQWEKYGDGKPPCEDWIWDETHNVWRPKIGFCPEAWVSQYFGWNPFDLFEKPTEPSAQDERLMCEYAVLAAIHDTWLKDLPVCDKLYNTDNEEDIPTLGPLTNLAEYPEGERINANRQRAIEHVEEDLKNNEKIALAKMSTLRGLIKRIPIIGPILYDLFPAIFNSKSGKIRRYKSYVSPVLNSEVRLPERSPISKNKPWSKKICVIIAGIILILGGIWTTIQIYESKTAKRFINSFKREQTLPADYRRTKLYTRTKKRVDDFYESIRNEKLDPWLFINAGLEVRVEKNNGDFINYNGTSFTGSPIIVFWSDEFIPPFIEDAIIKVFDQTIDECRNNDLNPEIYVYEAKGILRDFIYKVYNRMADMDQKLRKQMHPENSGRRDVKLKIEKMCKCLDEHYNAAILLASGK